MIRANELRIGNWIECKGRLMQVQTITKRGIQIGQVPYYNNELRPIPLTEEILLKCGFVEQIGFVKFIGEKFKESSFDVAHNDLDRWYAYFRNFNQGDQDDFVLLRNDLKYLHQLQNLYFALTSQELKIEL